MHQQGIPHILWWILFPEIESQKITSECKIIDLGGAFILRTSTSKFWFEMPNTLSQKQLQFKPLIQGQSSYVMQNSSIEFSFVSGPLGLEHRCLFTIRVHMG